MSESHLRARALMYCPPRSVKCRMHVSLIHFYDIIIEQIQTVGGQ